MLKTDSQSTVLTINGVAAGSTVAGPRLRMNRVKRGTLSARCSVDAETSSLTLSAVWEVSDDGTNWRAMRDSVNATPVVLATGTGGADAAVVRNITAPAGVYGCRYARCSIGVAGATGTSSDLATVSYDYLTFDSN